jgi:hypothetical protein
MPTLHTYGRYAALFVLAAFAAGGFFTGIYFFALNSRTTAAASQLQWLYLAQGATYYGVVESTDLAAGTITAVIRSKFDDASWRTVVSLTPATMLARQELQKENGVYVAATPLEETSLQTVQPGERVTLRVLQRESDGRIVANMIIIGTTL